eukprot:CAMPEP_0184498270 /NCGR_PEP_ID=MMETSP0113_2-20130426/38541_1 /TAXON_ID=91329 /ORGANISM="Norrisiella sphaerica, Strain BC52" /LENGTH=140 /DNA_ID=CAMNT_0026885705 /DNA_START=162 /DNA_END=581 /DNA_ORIENTATION=+
MKSSPNATQASSINMVRAVSYIRTCDVELGLRAKVAKVEGLRRLRSFDLDNIEGLLCVSVEATLVNQGEPIGLTNSTPIKSAQSNEVSFDTWLSFETRVSSLSPSSEIFFILRDRMRQKGSEIARARLPLFGPEGLLLQG